LPSDSRRTGNGAEKLFAHAARNVDPDDRREPRRYVVDDQPIDFSLNRILRQRLALPFTQEQAPGTALGPLDALPVHAERDQAALAGDRQYARPLIPCERSGKSVSAGCYLHGRQPVALDHDRGIAVDAHLVGPVIGVARQRQPGVLRIYGPLLAEAPAIRIDRDVELPGPGAHEIAAGGGIAVEIEGASAVILVVKYPLLPALQLIGHENVGGLRRHR
jgi:hypothetical protein